MFSGGSRLKWAEDDNCCDGLFESPFFFFIWHGAESQVKREAPLY